MQWRERSDRTAYFVRALRLRSGNKGRARVAPYACRVRWARAGLCWFLIVTNRDHEARARHVRGTTHRHPQPHPAGRPD